MTHLGDLEDERRFNRNGCGIHCIGLVIRKDC